MKGGFHIENQPWYYNGQNINIDDLLKDEPNYSFFVKPSITETTDDGNTHKYTIIVKVDKGQVKSANIPVLSSKTQGITYVQYPIIQLQGDGKFKIDGQTKTFGKALELIKYYTKKHINNPIILSNPISKTEPSRNDYSMERSEYVPAEDDKLYGPLKGQRFTLEQHEQRRAKDREAEALEARARLFPKPPHLRKKNPTNVTPQKPRIFSVYGDVYNTSSGSSSGSNSNGSVGF